MEEAAAQWIAETDRIIGLVQHEFIHLDEKQFHYKVHLSHCSISQIIQHILSTNRRLISSIELAIPVAHSTVQPEEYNPGYLRKYILNRKGFVSCNPNRIPGQDDDFRNLTTRILISKIIGQQNRIKELITLCKSLDMNRRVVPFRFFGLIKLSIAETIDYLILHQKSHFVMARHILMLQQI